ncbi:MAG: hypothetical protein ACREN7_02615 [Candidatus Dormibacteria bacterium]
MAAATSPGDGVHMVELGRHRRWLLRGLWLPSLFGLYLILVGTFIPPELYASVGAVMLAGGMALWLQHRDSYRVRWRRRWSRLVLKLPIEVILGLFQVLRFAGRAALKRGATGRFTHLPTPAGAHSRLGSGHRVLLTLASSTPPSSVILGVEEGTGEIYLHRIDPGPGTGLVPVEGETR